MRRLDMRLVGVLLSLALIVGVDALSPGIVLMPFVVVPVLLAATFASGRSTAWIAALATLSGVALGAPDNEFGTGDHVVRVCVVAVVVVFAVYAAQVRHTREAVWRRSALYDPLTGLPNRSLLADRLRQQLRLRDEGSLAVMFIDLDGFKSVNDTFGHAAGDKLLRHTAQCLQGVTRAGDTVARYAGDEFVVVCPDLPDVTEVSEMAERVTHALEAPVRIGSHQVAVGGSIGIAVDDSRTLDEDELLRVADEAMFEAKRRGDHGHVIRFASAPHSDVRPERLLGVGASDRDRPSLRHD